MRVLFVSKKVIKRYNKKHLKGIYRVDLMLEKKFQKF